MDVKWGSRQESKVALRPGPKGIVELHMHDNDAPTGVLFGRKVVVSVLSNESARKLGAALIRVANSSD